MDKPSRAELKARLRSRIGEKKIQRSTKEEKEKTLDETFEKMGLDKEKFKEAMKILSKSKPAERSQILQNNFTK